MNQISNIVKVTWQSQIHRSIWLICSPHGASVDLVKLVELFGVPSCGKVVLLFEVRIAERIHHAAVRLARGAQRGADDIGSQAHVGQEDERELLCSLRS